MTAWVGELSSRVSVVTASEQLPLLVGTFRCPPDDPAWRETNRIGDVAYVVVPRTAVAIAPHGAPAVVADATRLLLYNAGQEYRRSLIDPRGDTCLFIALGDAALEGLGVGPPLVVPDGSGAPVAERSSPAGMYADLQRLARRPSAPGQAPDDALAVDESLISLAARLLGTGPSAAMARGDTLAARRAETVRSLLTHRYHEALTLADVAVEVGVSPYHLHRQFRAATGWTLHAYRDHLRLREGLARVLDGAPDLASLAAELGYTSHSHFTARFRRVFGVTPSALRTLRRSEVERKILTADRQPRP